MRFPFQHQVRGSHANNHTVPSISEIHPYTKHERFFAPEIRLFEPCIVDEGDGAVTWRYKGRKPSYKFGSNDAAIAFQCALRGKILVHTFQVEDITSGRGSESTAQPLKLWSDLDGRNMSISFLVQQSKPYYHIDVPLRLLENSIHTSESAKKVRVDFASQRTKGGRNSIHRTGLLRRFSDFLRHSPPDTDQGVGGREPRQEIADPLVADDLPTQDTQFLVSLAYLRFEFTTSKGKILPCISGSEETVVLTQFARCQNISRKFGGFLLQETPNGTFTWSTRLDLSRKF